MQVKRSVWANAGITLGLLGAACLVSGGLNAIAQKDPTFEEFNQRVKVDQPFQWDDRMYLLPIPTSEIYNNPQLVQAPNY